MKKILFILFALVALTACSTDEPDNGGGGGSNTSFDNWNNPNSPNYKPGGYNPLIGEWTDSSSEYTYALKYVFTNDFKYQKSYYTGNNTWGSPALERNYVVNDKAFKLDRKIPYFETYIDTFPYKIETRNGKRVLIVTYPLGDFEYFEYKP